MKKTLNRLKSERDRYYPRVKILFIEEGVIFKALHLNKPSSSAERVLFIPNEDTYYNKNKEIDLFLLGLTK